MINKIIFRRIKFHNNCHKKFNKHIIKKGLFVFPAGPALASIDKSQKYHESLRKADLVFFDSGFFVLLLKWELLVKEGLPDGGREGCHDVPPFPSRGVHFKITHITSYSKIK